MKKLIRFLALLVALMTVQLSVSMAQEANGFFRFVHAIPGVSAIDVYVDGNLSVSGLRYGVASSYLNVPAGNHTLSVRPAGLTTELWQQTVSATAGVPSTLVASSIDPLQFVAYEDDFTATAVGVTRFQVIHAIANAPAVNIVAEGQTVVSALGYGSTSGRFDVPAEVYDIAVSLEDGTAVVAESPFSLVSNTTQVLLLYGTPALPEALLISAPTAADETSGFVRFAHTISDAPAVDIFANDTKIVPALAFGDVTEHLGLPLGEYAVEIRAEDGTSLFTGDVTVTTGGALTVVAQGSASELEVAVLVDDLSSVAADMAVVSVVNTISGDSSVSVTLDDGLALATDLTFGQASDAVVFNPTTQAGTLAVTIGGQSAELPFDASAFYGGVYYNAFVLNGTTFAPPRVVFVPTSLLQGIASAPGADQAVAVATAVTEVAVVVTEATAVVATEVPVVVTPVVATPEPTPVQPVQPVVVTTPTGPTGRVVLNPGANLQLRQYPSADALSLGLAPSGSVLLVNGREGAPEDNDGNVLQLNINGTLVDWEDPVTNLDTTDPRADLDATTTWLNVTYQTLDGGRITAWVNAQFLEVRNPRNELQLLKDLPTIPQNLAGEAVGTAVTPPPTPRDRVLVRVINLNPGVNLNIRRTPQNDGEILLGVQNSTLMEFVGLGASGNWVYVRYAPLEGGEVTGWVSTQYLQYEYNDRIVPAQELADRNLLIAADEATLRGNISGVVAQPVQPVAPVQPVQPVVVQPVQPVVVQPNTRNLYLTTVELNPGSNLNLRREPSTGAEVLARIPAGTQLVLTSRTADSAWFSTTYEGIEGWVSGQYVFAITYNGRRAAVDDVPVNGDVTTTTTTTTTNNATIDEFGPEDELGSVPLPVFPTPTP
ncbi:MAG: DUF4397 domain-containing protein [bacterium]|nr:DUF4397 domain-containing protein [bacterium]